MTRDKFYKKLNNDISKKLQKFDKSIKIDPVSISILRNFYFICDKNIMKLTEVLSEKSKQKVENKSAKAWAYERAFSILKFVCQRQETMDIAFDETKWEEKNVSA